MEDIRAAHGTDEVPTTVIERGVFRASDTVWSKRFHEVLRRRLRRERGAGELTARVEIGTTDPGDLAVRGLVAEAAAEMPVSWIRYANMVPVRVWHMEPTSTKGGYYHRPRGKLYEDEIPGRGTVKVPAGTGHLVTTQNAAHALHE